MEIRRYIMDPMKMVVRSNRNCSHFMVLLAILFCAGTSFAMGDMAVVVEKVADLQTDKCKYCGRHIKTGEIHRDAEMIVASQVKAQMAEKGMGMPAGPPKGRHVSVLIYRFEERRGGNFAVERPASVGFHIHLMEGNSVRKIFVFDEGQQALSQNVLDVGKFLKRGGKWVTVEQLSGEGVEAGITNLLEGLE
jgi:hypothetical protein